MGHDHSHSHTHGDGGSSSTSLRRLIAAFLVNTVFFAVVLAGAFVSNSLTLLAEALHMLTDSASLVLALFAAWVASKPADSNRTYGYNRAEVIAGFLNGAVLVGVAGYIVYDAYQRLQSPFEVDPLVIIVVGLIGLFANVAAAALLVEDRDNLNIEGAFLHLAVDAASSFAVVAGGVIIHLTGFHLIDPILAVAIACLVLYSVSDLLQDSVNILLQGSPRHIDIDEVTSALESVDGVLATHHVHAWALDSNTTAVSAHVVIGEAYTAEDGLRNCRAELEERFDFDHVTIQPEPVEFAEELDVACY